MSRGRGLICRLHIQGYIETFKKSETRKKKVFIDIPGHIYDVCFTSGGNYILVAVSGVNCVVGDNSDVGGIFTVDSSSGTAVERIKRNSQPFAVSSDFKVAIAGVNKGISVDKVYIHDIINTEEELITLLGQEFVRFPMKHHTITSMKFSESGRELAV